MDEETTETTDETTEETKDSRKAATRNSTPVSPIDCNCRFALLIGPRLLFSNSAHRANPHNNFHTARLRLRPAVIDIITSSQPQYPTAAPSILLYIGAPC